MASLNKVLLIGNLGKDPEIRHTENNLAIAKFSLATTEVYNDRDGNRQEKTEWHNVVAFRKLAEVAERFLKKGKQVYIEGKIQTRQYEENGQTKYFTDIVADQLLMLGRKGDDADQPAGGGGNYQSASAPAAKQTAQAQEGGGQDDDDLPF